MNFLSKERIDTDSGILYVANYVRERGHKPMSQKHVGREVGGYEVYLPKHLDTDTANYAYWLLQHPHDDVVLRYSAEDLQAKE